MSADMNSKIYWAYTKSKIRWYLILVSIFYHSWVLLSFTDQLKINAKVLIVEIEPLAF